MSASKTKPNETANDAKKPEKKRSGLYDQNVPTFYVGAGNNPELIQDTLKKLGWEQIYESNDDCYKLKWVQCGRSINWNSFREGEQMVNHIPNCSLFTNKLNLLCSLQAFEKAQNQAQSKLPIFMPLEDYVPLTYKLDDRVDKETYFSVAKPDELWICKPVSMNQGKGIYLVRDPEVLKQKLELNEEGGQRRYGVSKPIGRIIQKYITNPLLIKKRKFDVRSYMLIANTKPLLVLFHHGYLRLSMNEFQNDDNNLITHLTNQFFQKKDPLYKEIKEDTTWSMDQFNTYVNENLAEEKHLPKDWVKNEFTKKMHQIILQVVHSIRHKLQRKTGYFGVYGYDFMIDENMKTWLIEINVNPAITCNTDVLNLAIPPAISEGLHIAIECFEKSKQNKKLLPLSTQKSYTVIYYETSPPQRPLFDRSPTNLNRRNVNNNSPLATGSNQNQPQNSGQQQQQQPKPVTSASPSGLSRSSPTSNSPQSITSILKPRTDSNFAPRAALSSSAYRKSLIAVDSQQQQLQQQQLQKQQVDLTKTADFARMRLASNSKRNPTSLTSLELKPATVEVYFRTSSGKTQKLDRKALPSSVFPPPKIGLKS